MKKVINAVKKIYKENEKNTYDSFTRPAEFYDIPWGASVVKKEKKTETK